MGAANRYQIKKASGAVTTVVGDQNLKIMARDGRLEKTDHLRIAGRSTWHLAGTVKKLTFGVTDATASSPEAPSPPSNRAPVRPTNPIASRQSDPSEIRAPKADGREKQETNGPHDGVVLEKEATPIAGDENVQPIASTDESDGASEGAKARPPIGPEQNREPSHALPEIDRPSPQPEDISSNARIEAAPPRSEASPDQVEVAMTQSHPDEPEATPSIRSEREPEPPIDAADDADDADVERERDLPEFSEASDHSISPGQSLSSDDTPSDPTGVEVDAEPMNENEVPLDLLVVSPDDELERLIAELPVTDFDEVNL